MRPKFTIVLSSSIQKYLVLSLWLLAAAIPAHAQPKEFVSLAHDFDPTPSSASPGSFVVFNNALYFGATDGSHGIELWKFDGSNATRITDLSYGSANSFVSSLAVFNGALYFRGSGTTNGTVDLQLWKYDGTNVTRITEINAAGGGFSPTGMTAFNGSLCFSANDGTNGTEFWSYDGTNVHLVGDLNPGPSARIPPASRFTRMCFISPPVITLTARNSTLTTAPTGRCWILTLARLVPFPPATPFSITYFITPPLISPTAMNSGF